MDRRQVLTALAAGLLSLPEARAAYAMSRGEKAALLLPFLPQAVQPIVLPAAPYLFYSVVRLSTWNGYCAQARRADGVTLNIGFGRDNRLDIRTLQRFLGSQVGTWQTWYDQSGNGRNATQATAANQPKIDFTALQNGIVPISFSANNLAGTVTEQYLSLPTISVSTQAMTVATVSRPVGSWNNTAWWELTYASGADVGANLYVDAINGGTFSDPAGFNIVYNNGGSGWASGVIPRSQLHINILSAGASQTTLYVDGAATNLGSALTAETCTGGAIGHSIFGGQFNFNGDMFAFGIWSSALTSTQVGALEGSLNTSFPILQAQNSPFNLVVCGDSRCVYGPQVQTPTNNGVFSRQIEAQGLKWPMASFNMGVPGAQASTIATFTSTYTGLFKSGKTNLFLYEPGVNDITAGVAGSTIYTSYAKPVMSAAKTAGFKVGCCTILYESTMTTLEQTQLVAYNTAVKAGIGTDYDYLVDVQSDPTIGPFSASSNTALYVDGIHNTALGYSYWKQYVEGFYNAYI